MSTSVLTVPRGRKRYQPLVDADNCVARNRRCIKCGDFIRGCAVDASCPNCEHPIFDSIYGSYLIDCDPADARRLYDHSQVVYLPSLFLITLTGLAIIATLFSMRNFAYVITSVFELLLAFAMVLPVIALVGMVAFTSRRSPEYYIARFGNARAIGTAAGVTLGVGVVVALVTSLWAPLAAFVQATFITLPVAFFMQRLGYLAARVPNKRLASSCGLYVGFIYVLGGLTLAILLMKPYAHDSQRIEETLVGMTLLASLGALALAAGMMQSLVAMRKTLRGVGRF